MDQLKSALTKYTKVSEDVKLFTQKHKAVFFEYEDLVNKKNDVEMLLKTVAREEKIEIQNKSFKVVVSRKFRSWYDFDDMKTILNETQASMVYSMCIKETRIETPEGKAALKRLVSDGMIPNEAKQQSFREKELAAAVSIKELPKEEE